MKTKFTTIPQGEEVNEVMRIYKDKLQFSMSASAIDGTHIPIIAPVVDHADYVNRKGYHSIVICKLLWTASTFSVTLLWGSRAASTTKILGTGATLHLGLICLLAKNWVSCLKIVSMVPNIWPVVPIF